MTVQIADLPTEIDRSDALKLRTMAELVMANRPTFRRVFGRTGSDTVEIYTRTDRHTNFEQQLVVRCGSIERRLRPSDREALERIVRAD